MYRLNNFKQATKHFENVGSSNVLLLPKAALTQSLQQLHVVHKRHHEPSDLPGFIPDHLGRLNDIERKTTRESRELLLHEGDTPPCPFLLLAITHEIGVARLLEQLNCHTP